MIIVFTVTEIVSSLSLLEKYYGIGSESLPEEIQKEITSAGRDHSVIALDARWDTASLVDAYHSMGDSPGDEQILRTLNLLTFTLRNNPRSLTPHSVDLYDKIIRRDKLRLFVIWKTTHPGDTLILKNKSRSVRLANYANSMVDDLLAPYLKHSFPTGMSVRQALSELDEGDNHQRGRRPKDPRVPRLLWGTFQLLTDLHGFRTPMPNALCNFLIRMLQIQGVLDESTEIDAMWVRAQLRYLQNRRGTLNPTLRTEPNNKDRH